MLTFHKKVALAAIALLLVFAMGVQAAPLEGQPIYAHNKTDRPIWVAARYVPPGATDHVSNGFWKVNPGERILILYNNGRYIYFYARDDQEKVWNGTDTSAVVRGETLNMFKKDTGTGFDPWTMSFLP